MLPAPLLQELRTLDVSEEQGDDFLVLCSDGIWDHLSNEQAVQIVGGAIAQLNCRSVRGGDDAAAMQATQSPAQSLVDAVLTKVCKDKGLRDRAALDAVPCGRQLRKYHDDMTALVLCLRPGLVGTSKANNSSIPPSCKRAEADESRVMPSLAHVPEFGQVADSDEGGQESRTAIRVDKRGAEIGLDSVDAAEKRLRIDAS